MMLIKNGRVIDPRTGRDETADILVENGRICKSARDCPQRAAR